MTAKEPEILGSGSTFAGKTPFVGYLVMSVIAFVCAKYIATNWTGAFKLTFSHFGAFLLSWLLGGLIALMITSVYFEISHMAVPVFFARGFWWTMIGMFFGIYKGRKDKSKTIEQ